jgi:hypothetical protein
MGSFDSELRDGLEMILGTRPPEPEYDAFLFFKQWLAERNLGLAPIADAREFDWPGYWLARVSAGDGDHAVVMFGSPSGPLHDPAGALAGGGRIEEGWMLARLDVRLPERSLRIGRDEERRDRADAGIATVGLVDRSATIFFQPAVFLLQRLQPLRLILLQGPYLIRQRKNV